MKNRIFVLTAVCLFLYCCATPPQARVVQDAFPIDKPYDEVWAGVIETFAELDIPIDNMEKDSGLITTDWINYTGQSNEGYCDCGGLGINIEVNRLGRFNVFLKKASDNSCELKINCRFQQTIKFGDSMSTRACVSTGNLEKEFFNLVMERTGT